MTKDLMSFTVNRTSNVSLWSVILWLINMRKHIIQIMAFGTGEIDLPSAQSVAGVSRTRFCWDRKYRVGCAPPLPPNDSLSSCCTTAWRDAICGSMAAPIHLSEQNIWYRNIQISGMGPIFAGILEIITNDFMIFLSITVRINSEHHNNDTNPFVESK